jgi:aspartate kinase
MKVFKFGGASVSTVERIHNVGKIFQEYSGQLMVIISAMGKTTNALEKVVEAFFAGNTTESLQLFDVIKQQHLTTAKYLLVTHYNACVARLTDFFTEVEWLLHDKPSKQFDYYYDQVVCVGEMLSTCIVSHYLQEVGINNTWIDVRDVIRTDDNFRDATIDWKVTEVKTNELVKPLFIENNIVITQGFVGSTDENESTTLGREGSDFTAAIFANLLNAESLTIWKDVAGVMNADPKIFDDAQLITQLSFAEVIEMAYYGAQVIHPKTIKPLQNKSIPLHVKCFLDTQLPGTIIQNKQVKDLPPIIIIKNNQAMLHLSSQDFSFVGEAPMNRLYDLFGHLKIKPNLIQTGAISLQLCMDDKSDKIDQFAASASQLFDVQLVKNLTLLTIRHFTKDLMDKMLLGKNILLKQQTKETVQVLYS